MASENPAGSTRPHTVLASAEDSGGGGGSVFASSAADKKKAAAYLEQHQLPDTSEAGFMADGGGGASGGAALGLVSGPSAHTGSAPGAPDAGLTGMSAWAVSSGLSYALGVWHGQTARLIARLQGELDGLRGANSLFQGNDLGTGADIRTVHAGHEGSVAGRSRVGDL